MSFHHAPVSKGLMIGLGIASILGSLFDVKHYMYLQLVPHISRHRQFWRLFTHTFGFINSSELFIAEILLFNVSVQIERLFGSYRFGSFVVVATLASSLLSFLSLLLFHRLGLNYIPAGPIALLFSILYQYLRIVPSTYRFSIFSLQVTNKIFMYILAVQLAMSQWPGSLLVSVVGLLTGQIYRSDFVGLKSYRLPWRLAAMVNQFLLPLIGSTRPPRRSPRAIPPEGAHGPGQRNHVEETITTRPAGAGEGASAAGSSFVNQWVNELTGRRTGSLRVPTESEIAQLTGMFPGIRREQVITALQQSPNIERAVELLLETPR